MIAAGAAPGSRDAWPALDYVDWAPTCETLQLWTQVVGKVRLAQAPFANHWWHTTLHLTARGLTTGPMPYEGRRFQIDFDFLAHRLVIATSDGALDGFALAPMSVADFHDEVMARLAALGIRPKIWTMPVEIAGPIPFEADRAHASYDADAARRFWHALAEAARVMEIFRGRFLGKASPVHFFWGSFDLAVTRFSGRRAPPHPGGVPNLADRVTREAYSHEVSSAGFWPGNGGYGRAAFYSYAYPMPAGFGAAPLAPAAAFFDANLGEFILPYDDVRLAPSPDEALLAFLQSTYEAAADRANWDRAALER